MNNKFNLLHGISIGQSLDNLGHGGSLLADGNVDTVQLGLGVITLVESLLVDDGVNGDGGFASLSVADDQLTLATADGHEAVHGLDTGLHGLLDRLPGDDAGGLQSHPVPLLASNGALAVNGVTQSVHNAAKDLVTDGHVHDGSGPLDDVSLLDELVVTEHDHTDVVGLQVESHALQSGAELHHPLGLDVLEAIDTGDTVTNGQDTASLLEVDGGGSSQDSLL